MAKIPVPKYGEDVKDATGKVVGQALFDPNTGKPLKQPTTPTTNNTPNSTGDAFLSAIQAKLMEQTGVISSTNSKLESRISAAIAGVNQARDATGQAIESQYNREADFQSGQAALGIQNQLEGRVGFATQMVAFRNLVETTDKSLKDLEQRKQELLLQNDAQAAAQVSQLQMKALEFQQQAQQQTFSNLLGIANFGLQSAQEKRLNDQNTLAEKKAMSDIALQYGLEIKPGETIDSITSKAMVFASDEQKARLAKLNSEIKYTNAQTAKILAGDPDAKKIVITPEITNKLATRWNELTGKGLTVDTSKELESIYAKFVDAGKEADFYDAIAKTASENAQAQIEAKKATEKTTTSNNKQRPGGLSDLINKTKNFGLSGFKLPSTVY